MSTEIEASVYVCPKWLCGNFVIDPEGNLWPCGTHGNLMIHDTKLRQKFRSYRHRLHKLANHSRKGK